MMTIWAILLLLAAVGWFIYLFNTLVGLSNQADAAWAEIDMQLGRRQDLTGKLLELATAHALAGREQLAAARTGVADTFTPEEKSRVEPALTAATHSVLAAADAHPELSKNEEFIQLRETLRDLDQYLHEARQRYNELARQLNERVTPFPNHLAASLFGVGTRELFGADGGSAETPV